MHRRLSHFFLAPILVFLCGAPALAGTEKLSANEERHVEVAMRMIGHQVLLAVGDPTSLVLPIEKNGDQYKIRMKTEFGFVPEDLALTIDSVISATQIAKNYIVEFVSCDSNKVVHSYEVAEIKTDNVLACKERAQPVACYMLWITLLDQHPTEIETSGNSETPSTGPFRSGNGPLWMLLTLLTLGLVGVIVAFRARRSTSQAANPNVVQIGEFQFNKRNMELVFKKERIRLTSKEADLLQLLSASMNDTVERDNILTKVWGDEGDYVGRTLDVFISKLRKKLEADANVSIVNVRGVGYKLVLGE